MGEYVATLLVDDDPIELFSWHRPVWMKQTDAGLIRVIPTEPHHMLTDAIAFFVLGAFDHVVTDRFELIELESIQKLVDIEEIRRRVYELDTSNLRLVIQFDGFPEEFDPELVQFKTPPKVTIENLKVSSIPGYSSVTPFSS